jgi:hypothetical protein
MTIKLFVRRNYGHVILRTGRRVAQLKVQSGNVGRQAGEDMILTDIDALPSRCAR